MNSDKLPANQPPRWTERFGKTIAALYENDDLSEAVHNELSDSVLDLTNRYANTPDTEARLLLPLALAAVFDTATPPRLNLTFQVGQHRLLLCERNDGDISRDFARLVLLINQITKPYAAPASSDYGLRISLVGEDGEGVALYDQPLPLAALPALQAALDGFDADRFLDSLASLATDPQATDDATAMRLGDAMSAMLDREDSNPIGNRIADLIEDECLPVLIICAMLGVTMVGD